jgi:hypothetical protein
MNAVLLSFADPVWEDSFIRIKKQIEPFDQIKYIDFFNIDKLDKKTLFFKNNPDLLQKRPYGYGAWVWKTYIIENAFNEYKDADFFIYSDSGNEFNFNSESYTRLNEYIDIADHKNIFAFYSQYKELQMAHCSVVNSIYPDSKNTNIINAGFLIIKNNEISKNIIKEWQDNCRVNDYYNVEAYKEKCCDMYMNNLSDQAVLSSVLKRNGIFGIKDEADWIQCSEDTILDNSKKYPVFNARNKTSISIMDKCLKYFDSIKCIHNSNDLCDNMLILR